MKEWYVVDNVEQLSTPCLVVYKERVVHNIRLLLKMVDGNADRLRPHVKTCKAIEPVLLMMEAGITKFKCATIAEAEMLAMAGAKDILLAYQPVGATIQRLIHLVKHYPDSVFSCLVDDMGNAHVISREAIAAGIQLDVFIDLNIGMNRTGIVPSLAIQLFEELQALKGLTVKGLHAYDGHIHARDMDIRTAQCNAAFEPVQNLYEELANKGKSVIVIAGGSPTFTMHAGRKNVECSPGTFVYWDFGYTVNIPEQAFLPAVLLLTSVVSKPLPGLICIDAGHKAVASENSLDKRLFFIEAPALQPVGHSEEHMTVAIGEEGEWKVGDKLYAMPYHICPTVALHQTAWVVEDGKIIGEWKTVARNREIVRRQ